MVAELDSLIKRIKEEGVEEAKRHSEEIISEAEKEARRIVEDAWKEKENIIREGEERARNLKRSAEESIRQASRDILLSLRHKITELFDRVLKERVSEELSSKNLKDIITKVIENFKKEEGLEIEVLLSKKDKEALEATLLESLADEIKKGVTFKISSAIEKGFRIGQKGKNFYYDFSDDAIAEAFKLYLNSRITEILKNTDTPC